jgi:tryptophanyl-tRNA synthetase
MFFEPNDKRIEEIRSEYKSGRLLTGDLKDILVEKVTKFLREHRDRKEKAETQVDLFKKNGALAREMWKHDFQ